MAIAEYILTSHIDNPKVAAYLDHEFAELEGGADIPGSVEPSPYPRGSVQVHGPTSTGLE